MWQLEWGSAPSAAVEPVPRPSRGLLAADHPEPVRVGGLMWEEHCHECAEPDCYASCPLYARRRDGRCARLMYGIYPNAAFSGLFDYGAEVKFRRWGKLESVIPVRPMSLVAARGLAHVDRVITAGTKMVDSVRRWPTRHQVTAGYRSSRIAAARAAPSTDFEEFLLEVWNCETAPFRLVVEAKCEGSTYYRESVTISPGWNRASLPADPLLAGAVASSARLLVYPENDASVRMVFTWLDLVSYGPNAADNGQVVDTAPAVRGPADKVKCVVWDLDNTLWDGILADLGPDCLELAPEVRETIEALDERGILQTVASKNDHDTAWAVIDRLGLADMFLYPAIYWGPKSASIQSIATSLNLGLDAFAFIDDSPQERAEVASALPEVRIYHEGGLGELLRYPEFDVRPTPEAKSRRLSYLAEARRQVAFGSSSSVDVEGFLRSCDIVVEVSSPQDEASVDRCHELLLRSNQLNLSTRRYARAELRALIDDPARVALALRVRDRFGDYGLVGFLSLRSPRTGHVTVDDLVLSCRVAKKYVEHSVVESVRQVLAAQVSVIDLAYVPTARNGVLLDVLKSLGGTEICDEVEEPVAFELSTRTPVPLSDVVSSVRLTDHVRERLRAMAQHAPPHGYVAGRPATAP